MTEQFQHLHEQVAGVLSMQCVCCQTPQALQPHTALDAAEGGTNDVLAELCGITRTEPLEYVDAPTEDQCKFVVFVPSGHVEKVASAIFKAGAGHIGDYSQCSFRASGEGTFLGGETTRPAIGQRGRMESVQEVRLESIVRTTDIPKVVRIAAMNGIIAAEVSLNRPR